MRSRTRHAATKWTAVIALGSLSIGCAPDFPDAPESRRVALVDQVVEPADLILVDGYEFEFVPAHLDVTPGRYTVQFTNQGDEPHDLALNGEVQGIVVEPGRSATFDIEVPPGGIRFFCSIAGHLEAGMLGALMVPGAGEPPEIDHDHAAHADETDHPHNDDDTDHTDETDHPHNDEGVEGATSTTGVDHETGGTEAETTVPESDPEPPVEAPPATDPPAGHSDDHEH